MQREAKRVAELAAAAVMAAAAGGADTGEYPRVMARPAPDRTADESSGPPAGGAIPDQRPTGSHARHDTDNPIPAQQGPQPGRVTADAD